MGLFVTSQTQSGGGTVTGTGTANTIAMWTSSTAIGNSNLTQSGSIASILTQPAATSGTPTAKSVIGGAHTALAFSEAIDINYNLARTVQFTGNIAVFTNQRAFLIQAPTYAFTTNSTITNVATFAVDGAPIKGANANFTNAYSIWAQGGNCRFDGSSTFGNVAAATAFVHIAGCTLGSASLRMVAGTAPSAPNAGDMFYDGNVFYSTTSASATGINIASMYSIVPAGGFSLSTSTGVQSAFPSTGDVWTLNANTSYEFEGWYFITKSGTTCTIAMAFALGGGASITSILYFTTAYAANGGASTLTSTIIVGSQVQGGTGAGNMGLIFKGIIRMNAGGTVTPQVNFSASPTSPVMAANSYIKFTPIGTDTNNTQGNVG